MKVLITGITGFVGSHLADLCLGMENVEVFGTYRWRSPTNNIEHSRKRIKLVECDLRDAVSVDSMMKTVQPDAVFHLVAETSVRTSFTVPAETLNTNVICALNVFESVRRLGRDVKILVVGSSEEYGLVLPQETPVKETNPLRPLSPYAVSKAAQDMFAYQYFHRYKMHIVRTRTFNITGPRHSDMFVVSSFAKQIVQCELGLKDSVVHFKDLSVYRDYVDVRDVASAYWQLMLSGIPGEVYNVASGQARSVQEILNTLLKLSKREVKTEVDPNSTPGFYVSLVIGDATKLRECTGWRPTILFEQTLTDLLDYWRDTLKGGMH